MSEAKLRRTMLAYAALCILATSSQQTVAAAHKQVAKETRNSNKDSNRTLIATSELKRLSSAGPKAEKVQMGAKSKTIQEKKVALKDEEASKKFQPRMMAPAGSEQAPSGAGNQQPAISSALGHQVAQIHEPYYTDSWSPHSLVPTFTDQEQGDEMVALASGDSAGGGEVVVGPQAQYQQVKAMPSAAPSRMVQTSQDEAIDGNRSLPSAKQSSDEYYGDDEEEEEDQQQSGSHNKQPAAAFADHQHYDSKFTSPYNDEASFAATNGDNIGPLEDPMRVNGSKVGGEQKEPSVTSAGVSPAEGGGWLPATSSVTNLHHHYQQQEQQQFNNMEQPTRSEKLLASLFNRNQDAIGSSAIGGSGAYSKTGAAIEYLKNMLKSKQSASQQNQTSVSVTNTTITGDASRASADGQQQEQQQQQQQQADKQTASLHRLTSIASRLSQMLNNTVKEVPSLQHEQQLHSKRIPEAKFSVDDAKAHSPAQELLYPAPQGTKVQSTTTTIATTTTTTKLPYEQTQTPSVETIYPTQVQSTGSLPYAILSQGGSDPTAPLLNLMANGTPLGGDYVESMDEFPRGTQQQPQQQLYGLESVVMSVRQPLSPADQLRQQFKSQQDATVAKELAIPQVPQQPTPPMVTVAPASKPQILEQQQVQQVASQDNLDAAFRRQLMSMPNSSKYFQLAQTAGEQSLGQIKEQTSELAPLPQPLSLPLTQPLPLPPIGATKGGKQVSKVQQQVVLTVTNRTEQQQQQPRKEVQMEVEQQPLEPQRPVIKQPISLPPLGALPALPQLPLSQATHYYPQELQVKLTPKQLISNKLYQHQQEDQQAEYQPQAPIQPPLPPPVAPISQARPQQQYSKGPQAHIYQSQSQPQHHYTHHHQQLIHQQAPSPSPPPPPMPLNRPAVAPKKKPKIVSYNYFENPAELHESDIMATSYQLGDALYTSTGGLEHLLSQQELEAIQTQFNNAEHPVVPMPTAGDHKLPQGYGANYDHVPTSRAPHSTNHHHHQHTYHSHHPHYHKPHNQPPQLTKQHSVEETMRELASTEDQVSVLAPHSEHRLPLVALASAAVAAKPQPPSPNGDSQKTPLLDLDGPSSKSSSSGANQKKKNLIVYLNHPRPSEMSSKTTDQAYSLAQSALDAGATIPDSSPFPDSFISAKEFDGNGLSKESKQLDIANLGEHKGGQHDKEGLSVVVIGDAYKYKKIVLLISSKSGGLKFIPMVKDMK